MAFNQSMTSIRKELAEHGLVPRKGLGQHFLTDRNILNKIIRIAGIEKEDVVLEVGSGLGEMTLALSRQTRKVIAVEIDRKLVEILREKIKGDQNVEVLHRSILEIDFKELGDRERTPIKVVANLPYQISTPLLFRFIEARQFLSTLTLMLQREVAERMIASPGEKEYGSLSVFFQLYSNLSIRFLVKPSAFFPPPKVESAVVHILWRERPSVELRDPEWFNQVVRGCFSYRRKTLVNALKHSGLLIRWAAEMLREIGIDPRRRPETLAIEEFARLADAMRPL
jgi:16S rRNA (adenine1518-N6/adenine1519-N6)-dimethyltransferase